MAFEECSNICPTRDRNITRKSDTLTDIYILPINTRLLISNVAFELNVLRRTITRRKEYETFNSIQGYVTWKTQEIRRKDASTTEDRDRIICKLCYGLCKLLSNF